MVIIKKANIQDVLSIKSLERNVFGKGGFDDIAIREAIALFPDLVLVAEEDGEFSGYSISAISQSRQVGWVLSLGVREKSRRKGIAAALCDNLFNTFKGLGVDAVKLSVHPENKRAISFYEKLNFSVDGESDNFFMYGTAWLVMTRKI